MRSRLGFAGFIVFFQSILLLAHYSLYKTWTFQSTGGSVSSRWLPLGLGFLSVTFLTASVLAFGYTNGPLPLLYRVSAVWRGIVFFLFSPFIGRWLIYIVASYG